MASEVATRAATAALAEWATALRGDVPAELDDVVVERLLDYSANLLGGVSAPSVGPLTAYARTFPGPVPLPDGTAAQPELAALPWGAAAHALENDDTHQPSSSHPGAVVFSTLLPLALARETEWDAFVAAAVAGYEVMCRIATASGPATEYARGFHPTGTAGAFGAAAAAVLVADGDAGEMTNALGIAGSMSSGSMSFLTNGSWTKHLHPGWAAHGGMIAATLARDGYRGPELVLERPHGYFAGHSVAPEPAPAAELGARPYAIERTSTKAHGCCRYEQAALDAILDLRRGHALTADDVAEVRVGVLDAGWEIIASPLEAKRRPASAVHAQFSMPFGAAVALLQGSASVFEHTDAAVADPRVHALMDRVECVHDASLEVEFPAKWPASVEIRTRDGRVLATRVEYPKGDPENPFTRRELEEKLHELARELPEARRQAVVDALDARSFEQLRAALAAAWPGTD